MSNIQKQLNDFVESTLSNTNISTIEKSSILKNVFDSKKAIEESEKTKADTENAKKPQPKEGAKLLISTLAPLLTAIALIATLWFQISQSQENKKNQIQAEEDAAWRDMLKQVGSRTAGDNLTLPVLIKSFNNSEKYGKQARDISILFLGNIIEPNYFKTVFKDFVKSSNWDNLTQLVTLSNILKNQFFNAEARKDSIRKDAFDEEINYVGQAIVDILKSDQSNRPRVVDLSGAFFRNQVLDSINFKGAIISGTLFNNCSVKNADFTDIVEFKNPYYHTVWERTAWWRTDKIDNSLVKFLLKDSPRDSEIKYFQSLTDSSDYMLNDSLNFEKYNR